MDGLGLNSPGVRPVGHRLPSRSSAASRLASSFWEEVDTYVTELGKKGRLRLIAELALGRHDKSPFGDVVDGVRVRLDKVVRDLGQEPLPKKGDIPAEIAFRRVLAWGKIVEDADHRFVEDMVTTGAPLGVRGEIPWVEAVYDKKPQSEEAQGCRWEEDVEEAIIRENYASAKEHMDKVKGHVLKDVEKGWMVEVSRAEAEGRYGDELQVASLGAVPKDKHWADVRVVHDGTHGLKVNTRLSQPNRMAFPQFDDLECAMRALKEHDSGARFLMAFDIKSAHRLIPVHRRDWGLQACRLEEEEKIYLNTRGTFGVASAAFWWGRLAGLIFRTFHKVIPVEAILYLLLFADDGLLMVGGAECHRLIIGLFLYLEVMEVPLSWAKTRGGSMDRLYRRPQHLAPWSRSKEGGVAEDVVLMGGLARPHAGKRLQRRTGSAGVPGGHLEEVPTLSRATLRCLLSGEGRQFLQSPPGHKIGHSVL